jgi:hypothetical protein
MQEHRFVKRNFYDQRRLSEPRLEVLFLASRRAPGQRLGVGSRGVPGGFGVVFEVAPCEALTDSSMQRIGTRALGVVGGTLEG